MAQRARHTVAERIARLLARTRYRGAVIGGLVVLVLAAVAFMAAGSALAGGTSFSIERAADGGAGAALEDAGGGEGTAVEPAAGEDAGVEDPAEEADAAIVVDVDGAVGSPGVYELPAGARVADAVAAAGGLATDADTATLNQAAALADGQKVYVPRAGEAAPAGGTGAAEGADGTGGAAPASGGLININSAGIEELDELPGIGPATAQAIVDDRAKNGPFASTEDLMRVSGIGEKKFEKLSALICI